MNYFFLDEFEVYTMNWCLGLIVGVLISGLLFAELNAAPRHRKQKKDFVSNRKCGYDVSPVQILPN